MARTAKNIIILGFNGTGKTTYLKNLLLDLIERGGVKALIVTAHDMEWNSYVDKHGNEIIIPNNPLSKSSDYVFSGIQRHIFDDDDTLKKIDKFTRGVIVFDDCRSYFDAGTDKLIRKLLIARRQRMVDVISVGHGFTQVPPEFFTFASHLVLFKTIDDIKERKSRLEGWPLGFEGMVKKRNEINQKAKSNPHYHEVITI